MMKPFRNEPLTDFRMPENVSRFRHALDEVRGQLGGVYPVVIGGERIFTDEVIVSTNPASPGEIIGRVSKADARLAERAVESATAAFDKWRGVAFDERARYLFSAAGQMRRRKHQFSALLVLEVGKTWTEADADTAEAIDFLEFYGRQMLRLGPAQPTVALEGHETELTYIPLGVGVVIPPWNFPNAIATGMTAATIVSGNTAILKPSSLAPVTAAWVADLFNGDLMLPPGVLNFVPGAGGEIGDLLVDHPRVRFVAFTGSMEVGRRIFARAAQHHPGQKWLKRTILEMGGKDAIVVDETADLEAAADGIVAAAFGFQGQKCSACSRAIIVSVVYDRMIELIRERTGRLLVDDPAKGPEVAMGPVVDGAALEKHLAYIEVGKSEGRLVIGGEAIPNQEAGSFLQPTVFADLNSGSRMAQEEIFGPILSVIKAADWNDAVEIANNTQYGLTGAVYSRRRDRLEEARQLFHVGNLYFNRKCTGALAGVQPFGGFNMSGTDSKAGGPDYLLLFTQAKVISEREWA